MVDRGPTSRRGQEAANLLFAHMVRRPEGDIDLAAAALLVAEDEYPGLEVSRYLARLDGIADAVRAHIGAKRGPYAPLLALSEVLYGVEGFHGNRADYYDPRNSFLSDVIDRRTGIPITLAIVYLEVGWRIGLRLDGISFPGHFLVRYACDEGIAVIDAFNGGRLLREEDLADRLKGALGPDARLLREHLAPATKPQMLTRLLANLRNIYRKARDARRTLRVLEKLAILNPDDEPLLEEQAALRRRAESAAN